ncbi:aerotolerance regulator BatA [Niastella koreensis]|uniref:von Willebrand factor type A n=2 Tax=Niastella koreensis TaxID=354356 RepID=G8TL65_NIAKG|nr:VWA domain-containing protein [Niastella koreensis]AEW01906.1 von Willebrand factor type A [Niastella koreensis GR20-10]OQP48607.1 aerotolerance regulator BatA [Niastella koreensis]
MLYNWFEHITFAYPEVFGLFVLIPAMLYWYLNKYDRKQGALKVSSLAVIRKSSSWKSTFRHAPFVIRLLAVCCIIMAMARPQTRNDEELKNGQGIDIILCLDVSGSMLAQDFLPDRLEASKNMAASFVDMRPTDRIGVVIFSGESFTLVPLTTDKTVLKSQIFNINRGLLEDGTAIGDGLGVSVDRLKSVKTKSKVIILLTDGEDQGGRIDPLAGKELAKAYGIRVYTIGVGSEGYAPVPTSDGTRQQKVNIDEKLLRMIANETGGLYFRARDNESLKNIYLEIDKLEKSRIEVTSLKRYTERFFPFAFAAAALLFLEIFLRYTLFKKFP